MEYFSLCFFALVSCGVLADDTNSKPCFNVDSGNYAVQYINRGLLSAIKGIRTRRDDFKPSSFPITVQDKTCTVSIGDANMKLFPLVHMQDNGEWSGNDTKFGIHAVYYAGDYTEVITYTVNCNDGSTYNGKLNIKVNNYQAHTYKEYELDPSTGKHNVVYHELLTDKYGNREYSNDGKVPTEISNAIIATYKDQNIAAVHDPLGNTLRYYDTAGIPTDDVDKYISYDCNYHPAPVDTTLSEKVTVLTRAMNKAGILKTVI